MGGAGFVPLVTPTTTDARVRTIATRASGMVYCVSVTGITGNRTELPADLSNLTKKVRSAIAEAKPSDPTPMVVGFGSSTREHVETVAKVADGAVMGSSIIRTIDAA